MGFLDRFRRRQNQDDGHPEKEQSADSTTMYDKVDNPELEGGVPDVQSAGSVSKSPQQMVLLGVALLGSGLAIATTAGGFGGICSRRCSDGTARIRGFGCCNGGTCTCCGTSSCRTTAERP